MKSPGAATSVTDDETYLQIKSAKKPKSGVPRDLPRKITEEFAPELSTPVSIIINSILATGEWPQQWKLEQVIPIAKISQPQSEDDLRPISLTPFLSKVTEHFIAKWLLHHIGDKIDFRQYGGQKGNSVNHYLIELINFILYSQDSRDQVAVLACIVDFKKAFNRQSHEILVTKLSDLGVPGWLLLLVIAFLKDRKMKVNFHGKSSSEKYLPGGGPQGTIIALILFLVLINDLGFSGQLNNAGEVITKITRTYVEGKIHLKYVDDFTVAESIDLHTQLRTVEKREYPDSFHERTGHVLPVENSKVLNQLMSTLEYAGNHEMKLNQNKTKLMVFNNCTSMDFMPHFNLEAEELHVVEEMKLLGVHLTSDLKWHTNTSNMIKKANSKLWILRRLKKLGADQDALTDIYCKQVRCHLEFAAPVWQGAITKGERSDIERVQRCALRIILNEKYDSYESALKLVGLEDLESRRTRLCLNFALKATKNVKYQHWFSKKFKHINTRSKTKFCTVNAKHARYEKSPISYLTQLLNKYYE